ncbi:hypothetical protein PCL_03308 [Purpureocillium lilacinum]|uniref:Uncharacterized protein n=1 Tax=Purpureocillium lilacinum TaxID=33203 RepID=A0A2U3ENP1_PURLI|nr:hypothetical protein PCL_03308 [Purpureocillium lilacinum]
MKHDEIVSGSFSVASQPAALGKSTAATHPPAPRALGSLAGTVTAMPGRLRQWMVRQAAKLLASSKPAGPAGPPSPYLTTSRGAAPGGRKQGAAAQKKKSLPCLAVSRITARGMALHSTYGTAPGPHTFYLGCLTHQPGKGGRTATRNRPSIFRCPPVAKPPERQSLSLPLPQPPSSYPHQQPSSHRPTRPPVDTSRGPPRTHLVSRRRQAINGLHPVASSPAWPERRAPCRSPIASPLSRWGFVVPAARSLRAATTIDPLDSALSAFFPSLARLRTPGPPASLVVFWAP